MATLRLNLLCLDREAWRLREGLRYLLGFLPGRKLGGCIDHAGIVFLYRVEEGRA